MVQKRHPDDTAIEYMQKILRIHGEAVRQELRGAIYDLTYIMEQARQDDMGCLYHGEYTPVSDNEITPVVSGHVGQSIDFLARLERQVAEDFDLNDKHEGDQ